MIVVTRAGAGVQAQPNELVDMIACIAGKPIRKRRDPTKPQGVRGRNADLTLMKQVLGWQPTVSLEEVRATTYRWIHAQLAAEGRIMREVA